MPSPSRWEKQSPPQNSSQPASADSQTGKSQPQAAEVKSASLLCDDLRFISRTPQHIATSQLVAKIHHGSCSTLHVLSPANGPSAPGDHPPVHALLHQHKMSRRAAGRGYARSYTPDHIQWDHTNTLMQTATSSHPAPLPPPTLPGPRNRFPDPKNPGPRTAPTIPRKTASIPRAAQRTTSPKSRSSFLTPSRL